MNRICFQPGHERAFGTWPLKDDACRAAVTAALEAGYRAFDTAQMYGNEAEVGAALQGASLPRDALFVTTKVHPDNFDAARFISSVEKSVEALGLGPVDLLLLHWPPVGGDVRPSLELLSEARARGLTKHVGVSNYTVAMLKTAVATIPDPIAVNQVEFHPFLDQTRLMEGSAALGVPLAAYCAVARGAVMEDPVLREIGAACGRTAAQVALRWILQKGVMVNAMSTRPANIRANFDVMDFTLSHVDMARIDALRTRGLRIVNADIVRWAPDWD